MNNITAMRRFHLVRTEDVSGVSGVGVVAEGVEFTNGRVAMTWKSQLSVVSMAMSIKEIEAIHGHEGKTKVVWLDV